MGALWLGNLIKAVGWVFAKLYSLTVRLLIYFQNHLVTVKYKYFCENTSECPLTYRVSMERLSVILAKAWTCIYIYNKALHIPPIHSVAHLKSYTNDNQTCV